MQKHVLITGGTGLIGQQLTQQLLNKGYTVSHLSRKPGNHKNVATFLWDLQKNEIDKRSVDGVDTIVHLAGTGIADKRWTEKRKAEILESRTKSIGLIYDLLKSKPNHSVKHVISASGVGYYSDRGDRILTEDDTPAHDFLGKCCVEWENAVDDGKQLGINVTKFRTGVVLTKKEGALPQLALPVKLGVGSPLGSGNQWVSWLHLQDAVGMYLDAIEGKLQPGTYNMAAPNPVTNKELTKAVAWQLKRPLWAPNVPAFIIKLLFGELSTLVLGSTRVSTNKIEEAGYKFKFAHLADALKDIYG
ncbi:TIGR01777 family oxidoreductase [Mucilaginibacter aquatilis]|uniref:TIGR01777 family protein n=1 Tax=Mucilaginibacter aquatilis TaxID=1517760 RepID=A0A6I4IPN6_9SPHI|nr:TIGR01777 family oxidoreductase [Mucilaginibacter aquatilis]MVN90333.1 TIGR01777 family protein [Mucilaginibacter aquatilis]